MTPDYPKEPSLSLPDEGGLDHDFLDRDDRSRGDRNPGGMAEDIEFDSMDKTQITAHGVAAKNDPPSQRQLGITLGDFRLIKKLGQGAMAAVFKAWQLSFDRKVALKILHKHTAENPKLVERFYREARTMGQLDHPNIVQGYGVGEIEGQHYFAMEYVSGRSLQEWILHLGKLSVGDAILVTLACAAGLEYAHNMGLVHRDIKPENILVTRYGEVKVADLGMVKSLDEDMSLTQTGHAVGTPWYMPLEQARNAKETDRRSDIYALGCVLFCMLTGKPPFQGSNLIEVIRAKEIGTVPTARRANIEIPERLDLIINKMVAKLPKERFQSCAEVMRELEALELASPYLSFVLAQSEKKKPKTGLGPTPTPEPVPIEQSSADSDSWYVRRQNEGGEMVQEKLTSDQVIANIQAGVMNPDSKASRHPDTGFRSLAAFKEFEQVALMKSYKAGTDKRTARYRELFKQLAEQDPDQDRGPDPREQIDEKIEFVVQRVLPIAGVVLGALVLFLLLYFLFN